MIPGILRLNSKIRYGMTSRNVPLYLFHPLDRKLPECIVGCSQKDVSSNVLALVNVEQWETNKLTRGNLVKILGPCGDRHAEEDALLHQYSGPTWGKVDVQEPDFKTHTPIRGFTFNVDPEGCVDIDDVFTIGDDGHMYITIADVASWMAVNPHIFEKASQIGQTLYKDGRVVAPLLPIQNECSFVPGDVRHGLALRFLWSNNEITDISFLPVKLVNDVSFTYDSIYKSEHSKILKDIASWIADREVTDSHEWIERLMLFYNREAAKQLVRYQLGLLRVQDEPDIEKLRQYSTFGVDIEILANKSAYYSPAHDAKPHWGLGFDCYCHATSPIRRFADIVNQMALSEYKMLPYDLNVINERNKSAKKYERDLFFLQQVLTGSRRDVYGVVLNDHRIWIPAWRRVITCKNTAQPGTRGRVKYSVDMDQPTWKKRMVFQLET
jgi:exoribonuclease R